MHSTGKAAGLKRMAPTGLVPRFAVLDAAWIDAEGSDLPRALAQLLTDRGLRPPFAVRSSASDEDGRDAAFAGMY